MPCAVIGGPRDGVRRVNNVSDCQTALMQQSTAAYGPNENITTEVLAKAKHAEEHRKLSCYSQFGKDRAWIVLGSIMRKSCGNPCAAHKTYHGVLKHVLLVSCNGPTFKVPTGVDPVPYR